MGEKSQESEDGEVERFPSLKSYLEGDPGLDQGGGGWSFNDLLRVHGHVRQSGPGEGSDHEVPETSLSL